MEQRALGTSGLTVSALGLGCMGMSGNYGRRDETESLRTLEHAHDSGISFFDTADIYGNGHNETLIGRAFAGRFQSITLATKCGLVARDGKNGVDGSPAHVKAACEASLKRLGTETIDLYYLHRPDPKVPIEDSVGAMAALKQAGKIRHIGLSEVNAGTLRRAVSEHPIAALQSEYSLFARNIEAEILPLCRTLGIGLVPFSPLGRGLLTGAIRSAEDLTEKGDLRASFMPRFSSQNLDHNLALVARIKALATARGATPAQIALAWVLAQGADLVPIPGTSSRVRLDENLAALDLSLTADERDALSGLAAAVAGERYGQRFKGASEADTPPRH